MTKIKIKTVTQGIDLAISKKDTADFFCIITIGVSQTGDVFILDIFRQQGISFREQVNTIIKKAEEFRPEKIGLEVNGFQVIMEQELNALTLLPIIPINTVKDKVLRAQMRSGLVESGRVFVSSDMHDFISELVLFPDGQHDDQFDAFDFALTVAEGANVSSIQEDYYLPEFDVQGIFD
jgi:predicted phage terminase large subunit-like protein